MPRPVEPIDPGPPTGAPMSTVEQAPQALAHFESWLDVRSKAERSPLSVKSAAPYRHVWKAWVQWLTSPRTSSEGDALPAHAPSWTAATAAHVMRFLEQGVEPSASARRGKTAPVSEITRRRYWRLLQQVYQHAVEKGLIARNPVVAGPDVKAPPQEVSQGLVLNEHQWQAVTLAIPRGTSKWDVRDRAILHLLMDAALSTAEIGALRMHHVGDHLANVTLSIPQVGKRSAQERVLVLGAEAGHAIRHWLEIRRRLTPHPATDPARLFLTNRGRPIGMRILFYLVSQTLISGFKQQGFDLPQHVGPHVLRNTRIVMWINGGMPIDEVCRRAGLKDFRSLHGLRAHINPEVFRVSLPTLVDDAPPARQGTGKKTTPVNR